MQEDFRALHAKRNELIATAISAASRLPAGQQVNAARCVDAFAKLRPPKSPELTIELITVLASGRRGGHSRKPGNIVLNWRKLMDIVPDITIAAAGSLSCQAWLIPFVGLYLWNKLLRGAEEPLSDAEATTILALWQCKDPHYRISEEQGFAKTAEVRSALALPLLDRAEYTMAVNRLLAIRCIDMKAGVIQLQERVTIEY